MARKSRATPGKPSRSARSAKKRYLRFAWLSPANAAFKHPMKHATESYTLEAKGNEAYYPVKQGTKDWVLAYEKTVEKRAGAETGRAAAQAHAATLDKFGFESKLVVINKDYGSTLGDPKLRVELWARTKATQGPMIDTLRTPGNLPASWIR